MSKSRISDSGKTRALDNLRYLPFGKFWLHAYFAHIFFVMRPPFFAYVPKFSTRDIGCFHLGIGDDDVRDV
jgi:hypothetical protein